MCGISGILTAVGKRAPAGAIEAMTAKIRHRGPDALGYYRKPEECIELGHARLAIVDLSPAGAQPMVSLGGRYVIVLNGEIYNYAELRAELNQTHINWRGNSDTEVLLAAIERWGLPETLQKIDGMFAFALWDHRERALFLARDRFGEKPLYVGESDEGLVFASQLSSILAYPGFAGIEDSDSIDMLLTLSYIPEPQTIFRNVQKLPAGTYASISPGDKTVKPLTYWSARKQAMVAVEEGKRRPASEIVAEIEQRLSTVIGRQMVADVPLGAFLSGGIDSSLVVALMQSQSSRAVKTFTVGFKDEAYNEADYARAVAKHLGTDHTEVILDWDEALSIVEKLPEIYDEPFADSSQLPTYLVSAVAREAVTVCLSGDAGDEIFGGYNRHLFARHFSKWRKAIPSSLHRPIGTALAAASTPRLSPLISWLGAACGSYNVRLAAEKMNKVGIALSAKDDLSLYASLVRRDGGLIESGALHQRLGLGVFDRDVCFGLPEQMMLLDTETYLRGDILVKVDRAAMAVALETRVPFLDHKLYALAWSLDIDDKMLGGKTKSVLRNMLAKHVPLSLFERPKAGFGVPIEAWLRGSLRNWAEDNLAAFASANPQYAQVVKKARDDFYAGRGHLHHFLWNVLMLHAWRSRYQPGDKVSS